VPAVEAARPVAKGKVGRVGFGKPVDGAGLGVDQRLEVGAGEVFFRAGPALESDLGAGVNATGGDVPPRDAGGGAGVGNRLWQQGVALEGVGPGSFAGIHVGFAGVAGGVQDEGGAGVTQQLEQHFEPGVIHVLAGKGGEGLVTLVQGLGKGLADITGGAEEKYHKGVSQAGRRTRLLRTF